MSFRILTALVAAVCLSSTVAAAAPTRVDRKIDELVQARADLGQFNGVVLVIRDGKTVFQKAYGYANLEQRVPNRMDTRFAVASITKQFTAAAILQLRDAGKLSLDDSICKYFEGCPDAWKPVTLKHLLNHTGGVPDYEEPLELFSDEYASFIGRPDNIDRILKEAVAKPLDFAPGSKFHYSNTGYILLSRVISKVSGESYERYVEDHLLAAADMTLSSIDDGLYIPGAAQGYHSRDVPLRTALAGVAFAELPLMPRDPGNLSGDHGDASLWTTAGDLAKWVKALEGGQIVSAASLAEMKDGGEHGYGYGLESIEASGRRRIRHTGGVNGFVSVVQWYPDQKITIVILSNYIGSRTGATMGGITSILFGTPYDVPRPQLIVDNDPAGWPALWGDYTFDGSPAKVRWDGEMLLLEVPGRFTAGLLPKSDGTFYAPFLEGTVRVKPDGSGFIIHRQGADMDVPRKPAGAPPAT